MHNVTPRVAGWTGGNDRVAGAAGRFARNLRGTLPRDGVNPADITALAWPATEAPVVRVLARTRAKPAVQTAVGPDGSFAVVDGEIYNGDLLGAAGDHTVNDARLLLSLYEREGHRCFARIDAAAGMTLFDAGRQILYVLRDAIGSVPVFHAESGGINAWSSEIHGLLGMGVERDIDLCALDYYLTSGYIPAPWSFVRAIRKLQPGNMLVIRPGRSSTVESYWRPASCPALDLNQDEVVGQLASLLPRALKRRYNGSPGTGLLLSGGVDSNTLAALMVKQAASPVEAFTFQYLDYDGVYNEGKQARACADHLGVRHNVIEFGPADIISGLGRMLAAYGEPFSYGLHSFKLTEIQARGMDALLCGTGADGWFPGRRDELACEILRVLNPFKGMFDATVAAYRPVERFCRSLPWLPAWVRRNGGTLRGAIWTAYADLPYYLSDSLTGPALRRRLYRHKDIIDHGLSARRALLDRALNDHVLEDPYHRFRFLSMRLYGAEMMQNWNHWSGRAHDLVIRAPYYDRDLLGLIHRLKGMGVGKPELRRYAATILPQEMAYGPKVPQSVPLAHWLRAPLRDFACDSLDSGRIRRFGLFDPAAVTRVLEEHVKGKRNHDWTIWTLMTVTAWQEMIAGGTCPVDEPGFSRGIAA